MTRASKTAINISLSHYMEMPRQTFHLAVYRGWFVSFKANINTLQGHTISPEWHQYQQKLGLKCLLGYRRTRRCRPTWLMTWLTRLPLPWLPSLCVCAPLDTRSAMWWPNVRQVKMKMSMVWKLFNVSKKMDPKVAICNSCSTSVTWGCKTHSGQMLCSLFVTRDSFAPIVAAVMTSSKPVMSDKFVLFKGTLKIVWQNCLFVFCSHLIFYTAHKWHMWHIVPVYFHNSDIWPKWHNN